jgi:Protein of unknown function (DUF669)
MIMSEDFSFSDLLKVAESAGGGFEALPNGEYDVAVDTASAGKTGSGKAKITVRYKVLGGPYANRTVFNDHVLSPGNPNAMVIWFRQMSAMGLRNDYFTQNPSLEKIAQDLQGRKLRIKLGTRTWQNVERNSVLAIMPFTGPQAIAPGLPQAPTFASPPLTLPAPAPVPPPPPSVIAEEVTEVVIMQEPAAEPAPVPPAPVITPAPSLPF